MPRARGAQQRLRIEPTRVDLVTIRKANVMSIIATNKALWSLEPKDINTYINTYNEFIEGALRGGRRERVQRLALAPQDFEGVETSNITDILPEFMEYLKWHSRPWKESARSVFEVPTVVKKLADALDAVMGVRIGERRYTVVLELEEAWNLHYSAERLDAMADINRKLRQYFKQAGVIGYTGLYMAAVALFNVVLGGEEAQRAAGSFVVYSGERSWPNLTPMVALPLPYSHFYLAIARAGSDYAKSVAEALLRYIRTGDLAELYSIIRNMTQTKRLTSEERKALEDLLRYIS